MRFVVVSVCVCCALFCSGLVFPASASIPCPHYCSVTGWIEPTGILIEPGPSVGTSLTISIRTCSNIPIPYSSVSVSFNPGIRACANAAHTGVTDALGMCVIQLRGGGCVRNTTNACVVTANGILITSFLNVKSPDNAAHTQSQADGTVNVVDLAFFGDEFRGGVPPACHDYDNDGICDTTDLGYFGDPFKAASHCTLP